MSHIEDCRTFARMIGAYLDVQLDAASLAMADAHLAECETCRERVELGRAMRGTLRNVTRAPAPEGLRTRMAQAMLAEKARADVRAEEAEKSRFLASWRTMVPLAGAAAVGLAVYGASRGPLLNHAAPSATMRASMGADLLEELVAEHARPLPPEQTDPAKVRALGQYVGVPVQPARFQAQGARLVGGRVLPVHTERAAMLQYEIGLGGDTRRVSVFVFDPRRIKVNDDSMRAVGNDVRVTHAQGYSVAVMQRGGVGYAVASDLEEERSAQLAALIEEARDD